MSLLAAMQAAGFVLLAGIFGQISIIAFRLKRITDYLEDQEKKGLHREP